MTGADTIGYKIVKIIEELYCSDGKVHTIAFLPHHRKMADSLLSVFTYACEVMKKSKCGALMDSIKALSDRYFVPIRRARI